MEPSNSDSDIRMLNVGYSFFDVVHLNPFKSYMGWGVFLASANTLIRGINVYLCYLMLKVDNANMASITKFIKSVSGFLQGIGKMISPFFYRNELIYLKTAVGKFWGKTSEIKEDFIPLYRYLRLYKFGICTTFMAMCIETVLSKDLIFPVYIPDFNHSYIIVLCSQYFQVGGDVFYVVAMDAIFLGTCGIIWRQYRLLGEAFNHLNEEDDLDIRMMKFKECVEHHNYLLEYIQCIQKLFQFPLLFQYLISVGSICIELFNASEGLETVDMILCVVYTCGVTLQLSVYCFPADMTSDVAVKFSHDVYNFDWYNSPRGIQKFLPLVLNQAQKEVAFSAGGLIYINKEAFTTIFKTAMSFMTFMQQMTHK